MSPISLSARLLTFAVLLPAFVAGTNQLLYDLIAAYYELRWCLYPWIAFTTAVLSWCSGRYLHPAWLRWLVFAWSMALVDLLTIAACLAGPLPRNFGFILISSQISLLVVWSALADVEWQWRLPGITAIVAILVVFTGIFISGRTQTWGIMLIVDGIVATLVCVGLRARRISLSWGGSAIGPVHRHSVGFHQFGIKHMFAWAAAIALLLVVARSTDLFYFADIDALSVLHAPLAALAIAAMNLAAIWAVLGAGLLMLRIAALALVPFVVGAGMEYYTDFLRAPVGRPWNYMEFTYLLRDMEGMWTLWLCLNAALLAALLLFLRASGYRLARKDHSVARASDS